MNYLIKSQVVKLGQEAGLSWPKLLPLALLRSRMKPRAKVGLSLSKYCTKGLMLYKQDLYPGRDEILNVVSLQEHLQEIEKLVLGTRAQGLDGLIHNILTRDYMYIADVFHIRPWNQGG